MTYPSVAQCKVYMNITDGGDDTTIAQVLADSIAQVERETLRTFVASAQTRNYRAVAPYVTQRKTMLTMKEDLVSVTSLTNGDGVVIAASDYQLLPVKGAPFYQIWLLPSASVVFNIGSDGTLIALAGSFGFSAACPGDIFRVILELTDMGYASRSQGSGQEITSRGTIIDMSVWPDWMVESVDRYVRK